MRHLALAFIVCCLINTPLAAERLMDIYRLAVDNDPQIKAAAAKRLASLEIYPQAKALLFPRINLSSNIAYTRTNIESDFNDQFGIDASNSSDSGGITLSLSQVVYRRDLFLQRDQADIAIKQANIEYASEQQSLITRVANRYFAVLSAEEGVTFAQAEKTAVARQLEQTKQRFNVGLIAITDVHEAQARYDQAVANEIESLNQLANSRENLRELTGLYHNSLERVDANMPLAPPEPADIDQWAQFALTQNLSLTAVIYSAQIASLEIERQRSNHFPSIDFIASHAYTKSNGGTFGGDSDSNVSSASVNFNIPIFQGGLATSKTREARYTHLKTKHDVEDRRRSVERSSRNSYLNIVSTVSKVQALQQTVNSTKSAVEATEAGFEVGTRTIVDVLNAQREHHRALRDFARSRYSYITNTLQLKLAAGTLTEEDINHISSMLNEPPLAY